MENKLNAKIKLNARHRIYEGHFPGNPVTPGVVQIQMVKEMLLYFFKKELKLISVSRCKFLRILNQDENPVVTFQMEISNSENKIKVSATGEINGNPFFKMNAIYQ